MFGGSLSETHAAKICKVMDLAMKTGKPVIGLNDSGGARIQEGVVSMGGYADIFLRNTLASGVIPQISVIMGPCAGGAVYSPAITDFIVMVENTSYMFITGPNVVKTVTHEDVTFEELGGAHIHGGEVGRLALLEPERRRGARARPRAPLVPAAQQPRGSARESSRRTTRCARIPSLDTLVPENPNKPYDMKEIITRVVDHGKFLEVHAEYARNIVVGFARLDGRVDRHRRQPAGAPRRARSTSTPRSKARASSGSATASTFRSSTFEDVPGFLPGSRAGARRHHPAGREAALRVLRGHRAAGHGHHAEGLRRRLRRAQQQAHPGRSQPGVADLPKSR